MSAVDVSPSNRLLQKLFDQPSSFHKVKRSCSLIDLKETARPSKNQKKETSKGWRSLVKCDDGLEHEYLAVIDCKNWKEYERKNFRVKESKVGLFYNAEEDIHEKRIEFKTLDKEEGGKSPDIIFQWDQTSSSLRAKLMSDICVVYYQSHSCAELRKMENEKSTCLFCLEELYEQLIKNGTQDTFDPHETMLRFEAKSGKTAATDVKVQSNAAGCLFETCLIF